MMVLVWVGMGCVAIFGFLFGGIIITWQQKAVITGLRKQIILLIAENERLAKGQNDELG